MLDGDEAGQQSATNISQSLGDRLPVSVIALPDGRHPTSSRLERFNVA